VEKFDFGWCQELTEADGANCTGDMYAGSYNPVGWTNGTTCTKAWSSGSSKNIEAAVVTNMSVLMMDTTTLSQPLNGTSLTYS